MTGRRSVDVRRHAGRSLERVADDDRVAVSPPPRGSCRGGSRPSRRSTRPCRRIRGSGSAETLHRTFEREPRPRRGLVEERRRGSCPWRIGGPQKSSNRSAKSSTKRISSFVKSRGEMMLRAVETLEGHFGRNVAQEILGAPVRAWSMAGEVAGIVVSLPRRRRQPNAGNRDDERGSRDRAPRLDVNGAAMLGRRSSSSRRVRNPSPSTPSSRRAGRRSVSRFSGRNARRRCPETSITISHCSRLVAIGHGRRRRSPPLSTEANRTRS